MAHERRGGNYDAEGMTPGAHGVFELAEDEGGFSAAWRAANQSHGIKVAGGLL